MSNMYIAMRMNRVTPKHALSCTIGGKNRRASRHRGLPSWFTSSLLVRCPKRKVVAQQLHDECGILVRILGHVVKLCDRIFKCGAGHLACLVWVLQHLILEDGVV